MTRELEDKTRELEVSGLQKTLPVVVRRNLHANLSQFFSPLNPIAIGGGRYFDLGGGAKFLNQNLTPKYTLYLTCNVMQGSVC